MSSRKRRPAKRPAPMSLDKYLLAGLFTCCFGMATALVFQPPVLTEGQRTIRQEVKPASTQPVKLYKLASTDANHDWGQVLGAFAAGGGSFDKLGNPKLEGRHAKGK